MTQFEKFRNVASSDTSIQERIKSGENVLEIASSLGFAFTEAEFNNQMEAYSAEDMELNDFELEMISGGLSGVGDTK